MMAPKGFDMNLDQIGAGKPALVFVYDPNLVVSSTQTTHMNEARKQFGDQVLFLIAKIGTPEGDQVIAENGAREAELLLFDPSGNIVKRDFALIESSEIIQWLAP